MNHFFLSSPGSERIVLQINPTMIEKNNLLRYEDNIYTLMSKIEEHSLNWNQNVTQKVINILREIDQEIEDRKDVYTYQVLGHVYNLLTIFYREVPQKKILTKKGSRSQINQKSLEKLNQVYRFIEDNYCSEITLESVAQHVGYNSYYFTRFFKENTGLTFIDFLNNYRINIAKWYLATENWLVSEVAHKSGFNSVKTFHHVFKKVVDQTPLQYRKSIKEIQKYNGIK